MADFFKKHWMTIVAVICAIVSVTLLAIEGFAKVDVEPFWEALWTVVDMVVILIGAIRKLLQKKASRNK